LRLEVVRETSPFEEKLFVNTKSAIRGIISSLVIPMAAVMISFAVGGFLIAMVGVDPVEAYKAFLYGIVGNKVNIGNVLSVATPLMLTGLGIAFAAKCSAFNIGAEGQLYFGAIFATWVGVRFSDLPTVVLLPLIILAGFIGGGLWGVIPGILKAKYSVNEIVMTVMLSEIAIQIVSWLVRGPMLDPQSFGLPQSAQFVEAARLPLLMKGTRLHAGLIIALLAVVVVYILLTRTSLGFRVQAVGMNAQAAEYAGMSIVSSVTLAMLISGGLAGIAGAIGVAGVHYRLMDGISPGYGFTGIVVSLLGKGHPFGVGVSAILFSALQAGADAMQRRVAVPVHLAQVIQAMTIMLVIIGEYLNSYQAERIVRFFKQRFGRAGKVETASTVNTP
jgi:simple sugar transport system permease protein